MRNAPIVVLLALVAAASPGPAAAKEIVATACGSDRCRATTNAVSGIATLPGAAPAPRTGRFYTIALRLTAGPPEWTVVYEARRGLVRAADAGSRAFLGRRWSRLSPEVRAHFAAAVRGLEPWRRPPPA